MKTKLLILFLSFYCIGEAQVIYFPDDNLHFKLLLVGVDTNSNNQIEVSEALATTSLNLQTGNISDLTGLEHFTNVTALSLKYNQITSLSALVPMTHLWDLDCSYNMLTSIPEIGSFASLLEFDCSHNQITFLNTGTNNFTSFKCSNNQLSNIILPDSASDVDVSYNQLTSLTVDSNITFELNCRNNLLTSLIINAQVGSVLCSDNMLTTLDLSNVTSANSQWTANPLESLFIKNGHEDVATNYLQGTPTLQYICADEIDFQNIQNEIDWYSLNITYNSYCTFEPGGTFYTVSGSNSFDSNQNGCDASDPNLPHVKYQITNGTNTGTIVSDGSGTYSIPVQAGSHTISPLLENPAYFNVSPPNLSATFPAQTSPVTQNFCISANGLHPDLDILILPLNAAQPGFDTYYSIIYSNKGNMVQSGEFTFAYDENTADYVSANVNPLSQTAGMLTWSYSNLLPFETREIIVTVNINSPTETPAVNIDDSLSFTAVITGSAAEETPADNTNTFEQIVVGSFDPNDITCLEGATISPEMVGTYVHYLIRFENTGTFPATNVVIADLIDTTKFDISTLVPIYSSHDFMVRTTNGNKTEFIFESINLPFDDANNDGYIAYKIKTRPNLVVGDQFSKNANIYFDYNAPIVTNTVTTTVTALATANFTTERFTIYPNPVNNELHISAANGVVVQSVSIYNLLGQLVLAIGQPIDVIDVSNLNTGNYFIKIHSENGTSTEKFIKQ